jgi:hypothetical protein
MKTRNWVRKTKHFLFSLALLAYTTSGYPQELGTAKIDAAYFEKLRRLDTCKVFIVADDERRNFVFRDVYLGAVDGNFRVELTRQIRVKVNQANSLSDKKLTIAHVDDTISLEDITVKDFTIYQYKGAKVSKDKVKSPRLSVTNGAIVLDLNSAGISDNTIVNFRYQIQNVTKEFQRWSVRHPYYSASASFEVYVPEIYIYHQETVNPDNLKIDYATKKFQGVIVGYYAPQNTLTNKLITPTYYNRMKDRDPDVNKATTVYCGYITHRFDVRDVFSAGVAHVDLKLMTINPIKN